MEALLAMSESAAPVRPEVVRQIAHWWQAEMNRLTAAGEASDPPSTAEVTERFGCTEEEALRGVVLGEHRYFSGTE